MAAVLGLTKSEDGTPLIHNPIIVLNMVRMKEIPDLENEPGLFEKFLKPITDKMEELGCCPQNVRKSVLILPYNPNYFEKDGTVMELTPQVRSKFHDTPSICWEASKMKETMATRAAKDDLDHVVEPKPVAASPSSGFFASIFGQ